jgi:hypothetical protein
MYLAPSTKCQQAFDGSVQRLTASRGDANVHTLFHGCPLDPSCTLFASGKLCSSTNCAVCNITTNGFDPTRIGKGALSQAMQPGPGFKRFGAGFYFAYNSSKSHDYAAGSEFPHNGKKIRCMLICKVSLGKVASLTADNCTLAAAPAGCDSVVGEAGHGNLNYAEAVVYAIDQAVPLYAVFYECP